MIGMRVVRSGYALFACISLLLAGTGCVNIDSFNPVTPQGLAISNLLNLELVLSLALFFLIAGLVGYSLVRFRRRPGDKDPGQVSGNRKFEIAWTVVPIVVLGTMFVLTLRTMQSEEHTSELQSHSFISYAVF